MFELLETLFPNFKINKFGPHEYEILTDRLDYQNDPFQIFITIENDTTIEIDDNGNALNEFPTNQIINEQVNRICFDHDIELSQDLLIDDCQIYDLKTAVPNFLKTMQAIDHLRP